MVWILPALAAIVAGALAFRCERSARGPSAGALRVWSMAIAQYAIASAALAIGAGAGWSPLLYRVYYLFGAVLNVIWLGLGTIRLLAPEAVALVCSAAVAVVSGVAAAVTFSSPLVPGAQDRLRTLVLPAGSAVMAEGPRAFARALSIVGTVVVLAGLAWSMVARRRQVRGLLLVAAGVLVVVAASRFARTGAVAPFSVGLAAGVALMYAGVVSNR